MIRRLGMPLAILFLFIVSCGPKEPVSKEEQGENPIVKVSEVRVDETEAATLLTLSGDDEITFNVYKLDDANMVVIDLPDTRFTTPERKIELANELVSHVSLSEFSDQYSTLSRMSFFFNQTPVLPSIKEEGKQLQIRFAKEGGSLAGMEHFDDGGRDDFGRPAEETAKNIQEITCSVDQGLVTIRVRANARLDKYLEAFDRDHQDHQRQIDAALQARAVAQRVHIRAVVVDQLEHEALDAVVFSATEERHVLSPLRQTGHANDRAVSLNGNDHSFPRAFLGKV